MVETGIVGVDPGTTSAVAIINVRGEVVAVEARRDWSVEEMTLFVAERCRAAVLASDVSETPKTVEKMAAVLGAETWSPQQNLLVREKTKIAARKNVHERDALAAAKKAYEAYSELAKKALKTEKPDEVFLKILRAQAPNIAEATRTRVKKKKPKKTSKKQNFSLLLGERDSLKEKLTALAKENVKLEKKLKKQEKEIEKLSKRKPSPTKETARLKRKIKILEKKLKERKTPPAPQKPKEEPRIDKNWLEKLVERHREGN